MNKAIAFILVFILFLAHSANVMAQDDKAFVEKARASVGLLYSQDEAGGLSMRCTVTAFKQVVNNTLSEVSFKYMFLSAAHCIGPDRKDKEKSATPSNIPFYITFDEVGVVKKFWPAKVLWVGYQSRGEDFAVFEVKSNENWPIIPIGDEKKIKNGAAYWNVASPLGLGIQVQEGVITNVNLDRPMVAGDINWSHTMILQQIGVNVGSSGSALVSKDTHMIVGTLVGTVGGSTAIGVPVSKFSAVEKAVEAGKYRYWTPDVNLDADGSAPEK